MGCYAIIADITADLSKNADRFIYLIYKYGHVSKPRNIFYFRVIVEIIVIAQTQSKDLWLKSDFLK